jgi:hypothetical protein
MKIILALLSIVSLEAVAQNAPATVRNPYPNYWCRDLPQHVRHSPVPVACPSRPQLQPVLQPSPNDPPLDIQKRTTELSK